MGTMASFCVDGSEQLGNCHVSCRCRVKQQPAVAQTLSRSGNTPTPPSAARTLSPNPNWSLTPANERGMAATRTTPRLATAPGKQRSKYLRFFDKCTNYIALYKCSIGLLSPQVTSSVCFYSQVPHNDVQFND